MTELRYGGARSCAPIFVLIFQNRFGDRTSCWDQGGRPCGEASRYPSPRHWLFRPRLGRALAELNLKNADTGKPAINARIGIEAGPVVVDAAGEIYSDAPNVAARVQPLAGPGPSTVECSMPAAASGG
jgi:hypothetical protein